MLRVCVEGLRQAARIGCDDLERQYPQIVSFDISVELNDVRSLQSDDLGCTVDYRSMAELIDRLCSEMTWKLVEKMSLDISREIFAVFPVVSNLRLKVRKNVLSRASNVAVEFECSREEIKHI